MKDIKPLMGRVGPWKAWEVKRMHSLNPCCKWRVGRIKDGTIQWISEAMEIPVKLYTAKKEAQLQADYLNAIEDAIPSAIEEVAKKERFKRVKDECKMHDL